MSIENVLMYFTNPVAYKIIADIENRKYATAKELALSNDEIPQATLYRYLRKMVSDGVLKIIDEKQIRNVTEKTYALGVDYKAEIDKLVSENSGEAYAGLFRLFCNGLINEFQAYAERDNIDIANDGSGFRLVPFYASVDELNELAEKVRNVIKPYYENKPAPDRQMRNMAIVYTPPSSSMVADG